jgi:hypothetical protein
MEHIQTTQEINVSTNTMTRQQAQDLYGILDCCDIENKYISIKDIICSLLYYPDQEFNINITKDSYKSAVYYLSINEIFHGAPITQNQAIILHDLLQ